MIKNFKSYIHIIILKIDKYMYSTSFLSLGHSRFPIRRALKTCALLLICSRAYPDELNYRSDSNVLT